MSLQKNSPFMKQQDCLVAVTTRLYSAKSLSDDPDRTLY